VRSILSGASCISVVLCFLQIGSSAQTRAPRKPAAPKPSAVQLQTPAVGQTVSGTIQLTVAGDFSNVAKVDYKIGNYRLAFATQSPFNASYNTALASDGNVQIETIAYDTLSNVLSDTTTPVVFSNYGAKAEVLNGGLPAKISGSATITLHAFDPLHSPAYWTSAIDGEILPVIYTDQAAKNDQTQNQTIDSTIYPNGLHEFYFTFHSNDYNNPNPPPGNENYRGMVMQRFDLENGRTFMEAVASYLHVYTPVGGTLALGCSRSYTNGDHDACLSPQWVPNDPTVASVDATGKLQGLKEGFTDVTLTEGAKTTLIHVWVRNDPGLPHFTTNGAMATTYVPGQSMFMVAPFDLSPNYVSADPNLLSEVRRAGINTLTTGIYNNPGNLLNGGVAGGPLTYADWLSSYNAIILPGLQYAAANGFRILGTGDDLARNIGVEAYRTLNWSPAKQAVQYAIQTFAQSGTAVSIEMIDEAGFLWGPSPTPPGLLGAANSMQSIACTGTTCTVTWPNLSDNSYHDSISNGLTFTITGNPALNTPSGTTYTVQNATANTFTFTPATPVTGTFTAQSNPTTEYEWFARANTCGNPCTPSMLDNSLATINSWVKSAMPTVGVSYPPGGIVLTTGQRNWLGPASLSDYASQYWDTGQQRPTYIFGKGVRESSYWMLSSFYARQPYMQLNRPQFMLIGLSDTSYIKNSPQGTDGYNPPLDQFLNPGVVTRSVASSMFAAAAAGVAGLRPYQYEDPGAYQGEVNSGPGSGIQMGAAPFYGATRLWQAMGYAGALMTKVLQPYLVSQPASSPALGRNVITGVRKSSTGTMLIVVNGWDGNRTYNVDFTPYKFGFGATRYQVSDSWLKTYLLPDEAGETLTLAAGETAVYIFPNSGAPTGLDNVTFLPVPPVGSSTMIVNVGYLYQQNVGAFGATYNCTSGCVVPVDRRLGDIFFQYTFLDPAQGTKRSSTVQALGQTNSISIDPPTRF